MLLLLDIPTVLTSKPLRVAAQYHLRVLAIVHFLHQVHKVHKQDECHLQEVHL